MESHPIRVCVDCLIFLANGEYTPPDPRYWPEEPATIDELAARIDREWPSADGWHLTTGSEEDDDGESDGVGFSWSPCDACGSRLGGDRHYATAYRHTDK
jgi:hypothetical protein